MQSATLPYDRPLESKMRVLDGPDFDLMKYRGRPTLLHIFATWCEPCAIEMPHIVKLASEYASQMAVVGINFRESDNAVRSYRKKYANALESGGSNIELPASLLFPRAVISTASPRERRTIPDPNRPTESSNASKRLPSRHAAASLASSAFPAAATGPPGG